MLISEKDVPEEKVAALTKLGITAMQARSYILLEILGESKAKTLSDLLRLPRQDVYRTLHELFEMGFVEKIIAKPTVYRAISSERCISLLIERRKQKNFELEKAAKKLFSSSSIRTSLREDQESNQIILVPKKESTALRARKLINNSKKSICVVSPSQKIFPWLFNESKPFMKALSRCVRIKILTDLNNSQQLLKSINKLRANALFEIKYLERPPKVSFGLYDNKKLILELSPTNGFLESEVIVTDNQCAVEMAINCFQLMYNQAEHRAIDSKRR